MTQHSIDTVVIGAGQAGIAMSEHLSNAGVSHVVLERARVAEAWRSGRWDSLVANGPAWHDRFPNSTFIGFGPDDFVPKESVADYFCAYAEQINAPIHTGVEVMSVTKNIGEAGFVVKTSTHSWLAKRVVAATGPFQRPVIPPVIPTDAPVEQIHSAQYRNPDQLTEGAVLVIGAGSSGVQIADELQRAGRQVYLAVGPHDRPPRAYRGRDFVWWLGVLGLWDMPASAPGTEHVTISVSGAYGGQSIDFRRLALAGMQLVGRAESFDNGTVRFGDDLARNIAGGDANYRSVLDAADAYITRNGLDLPEEPGARELPSDPDCLREAIREINIEQSGIGTIIWATGYSADYSWLPAGALDAQGKPAHQRGVSTESGVYFLGLPWQSRRGSSFIWGVWHDAKFIADQIDIQRQYDAYRPEGG